MGKILYEGLQDTHADFEFARRQWKKLGIEKDFDDAYNDYFEKHKDDDDWQDPVYSEDAWNEMVDSAKGKGKNESYVSTLGLRKYLMKKNAEDNGIELSDKMKDYLKDAPELEEELDVNKMGLRKYLNDKSRDRLNKDRLNRDKLNESEFHDEINQIYDDDPYVEHVKDEVDRLYAENDSFRERVDDWFDLHFPEEPDWQVNIGTLTHEELFQMLNDLGYSRIMGEGLNEGDLLGDDWVETPYGFRELEYNGYTITDDNGSGFAPTSYSVDYAGDEVLFDSLEDAKEFIDGLGNEDLGVEEGLNEESNSRFEEVKDELRELLNARKNGEIGHETFNAFISRLKQKYPGLPIEDLENEVLDEIYGKQSESLTEGNANPYANCQSDVEKLVKALRTYGIDYSDIYVRDTEGGKYQPYVGFTYQDHEDEDEMVEEVDVLFNADGSLLVHTTYGDHRYKSVDEYMRDEFYDFSEDGDDFYDESLAEEVKWVREKDYTCRDIFKNGIANALTSNGFGFGKSGKITLPVCGIHNSLIDENGNTKDLYTNTFNSLAINFKSKKKFVKDITPEQRESIKRDILALKNDAQKFVDVIFNDRKNTIYVLFDGETNYNKGWKQVDESLNEGAMTNGSYSLYNGWVKVPDKDSIPDEYPDLEPEYSEWVERAEGLETIEDIDSFIDDVYKLRQQGLLNSGEYGKENLIFKELRNNGYLQKAKDMKVEKQNQEMSLESLEKKPIKESYSKEDFGNFIEDSVDILQNSDYTNRRLVLDDDLCLYVGWSEADDGYEGEADYKDGYIIAAKIAERNDADWADFDFCNMPWDVDTGDVWDTQITGPRFPDGEWLARQYKMIRQALDDGIYVLESVKSSNKKSIKEAFEGQFAGNFLSDADKMLDFYSMSDEDFLYEYDYMTQEECDATSEALKYIQESNPKLWDKYEDIAYDFDDSGYEIGSDDPELVAVCKEMSDYVDGLTDSTPIDYNESLNEEEVLVEDGENDRAQELADYLEIDVNEVKPMSYDDKEFETPEGDFLVLTYDEAIEYAEEDVLNLIDDMGLQSFSKDYQDFIIDNFVNSSFISEVQDEEVSYYRDEEGDEEFAEELENMSELEFCRYLVDNFGHDDFAEMVKDHIDWNAVAEDVVATDGPANSLARYDGEEIELDTYYAYRTN